MRLSIGSGSAGDLEHVWNLLDIANNKAGAALQLLLIRLNTVSISNHRQQLMQFFVGVRIVAAFGDHYFDALDLHRRNSTNTACTRHG